MYRKYYLLILLGALQYAAYTQPPRYAEQQIHSHNDYKQRSPFYTAYKAGCGSIEADIFLWGGTLLVAHQLNEVAPENTLEHLDKIDSCIRSNNGLPYSDKNKKLQLVIDLKTEASPALQQLIKHLENYPAIVTNKNIIITITGNQPPEEAWPQYPSYIFFDGQPARSYNKKSLSRIYMFSSNFATYNIRNQDYSPLIPVVHHIHRYGKKIRFWGAPDNTGTWQHLTAIGVDYINTDHIPELKTFFKNTP
ncbi:MAG: alkaline phosphatase [Niabella sp.]